MKMKSALAIGLIALSSSISLDALAVTPEQFNSYITPSALANLNESQRRGLEVAIEQDLIGQGWGDSQANMLMVLKNQHGDESRRELKMKALEVIGDGDKSLAIFDQPRDVKGTAFLTFSHIEGADDQWIYLPALKRVKRINSRNKSGPFMGSEFSYEDIASAEVAKYDFNFLKEEKINNQDCYVIESFPRDKNSGYTRIISWIDKEHYRAQKIEFYDRKKSLLKTLNTSDYQLFLDKYWRPTSSHMVNHQTGKSTTMSFSDYKFSNGFSESDFSKNSLKRAK